MKKLLGVFVLAFALPAAVWAQQAAPPPCIDATFDWYMSLDGGCTIDDKVFSDFYLNSTASEGAIAVLAQDVNVVVDDTPLNPGLGFQGAWFAQEGQTNDTIIQFTVTVMEGGLAIEDASLAILGSSAIGGGFVNVAETICLGDSCSAIAQLSVWDAPGTEFDYLMDHTTFEPVMTIDVTKDILLVAQGTEGVDFASLSFVAQNFSEVPEPATLTLLGTGLVGLGGMMRRRKKSKK